MMRNKQYAKPSHYSSIETLDRRSKEFAQTFVPDLIAKNTHPAVEVFANDAIFQVRSAVASAKVKNAAGCASAQVLLDNLLKTFMVANAGDPRAMAGINSAFTKQRTLCETAASCSTAKPERTNRTSSSSALV